MDLNVGGSRLLRDLFEAGMASAGKRSFYLREVASCIERNGLDDRGILIRIGGLEEGKLVTFYRGLADGTGVAGKQAFIDGWLAGNE